MRAPRVKARPRTRRRRCPSWCGLEAGHDGNHFRVLAEIVGDVTTVYVRLHAAPGRREPSLVLAMGFNGRSRSYGSITLPWDGAEELIHELSLVKDDYAP